MPIARFQMPDGRIARFEVPDGTSPEQANAMIAQAMGEGEKPMNPTEGNSFLGNLAAATGKGMTSVARAVGVPADFLRRQGLPGTKEEADALDAPLMKTAGGKVGNVLGQAAIAAPAMLIPGANTYTGAALIGAGTGAAFTEGDVADRAKAAAGGALGGLAGKGLGDALAWGVPKIAQKLASSRAASQAANAQRDAAATLAQDAGYVLPPSDVNPSLLNEALGGFSGKIKTAQVASAKNQDVTNALARKALGIADDTPLTAQALDDLRKSAGQAYRDVSGIGAIDVTGKTLPAGVKVAESNSPLMFGKTQSVDAADLVQSWRQANADATAYFRSYARTADPETLTKARAAAAAAKQLDELISSAASGPQKEALDAARKLIAKSYTVEKALNGTTGDVSAQALAKELAKGKPLSGELLTAAQVAQAFPKATQALKEAPKAVSPLDYMAGLLSAGTTGPVGAAAIAARPAVRSMLLSKAYQGLLGSPSTYAPGLLESALPALQSEALLRALPISGGLLGVQLSQ